MIRRSDVQARRRIRPRFSSLSMTYVMVPLVRSIRLPTSPIASVPLCSNTSSTPNSVWLSPCASTCRCNCSFNLLSSRAAVAKSHRAPATGSPIAARREAIGPVIAQALLAAHTIDRLREASILDPLTGCSTRPHGIERLTIELKRAERSGTGVALLMVDIDHFKDVNDRFGHNAGDAVLTSVGTTMMQTLRASDVRCRWGGEEFLVVLPEAAVEQARQVAESLLRRIADTQVMSKAGPIRITASAGITVARPGEHDVETLIGRADRALYRAKAEGRACVRIVLGDFKGAPIGGVERPGPTLPFRDRRDPTRSDRRRFPGPGRRKTDPPLAWEEAEAVRRSAGDRATPRSAAPVRIPPSAG